MNSSTERIDLKALRQQNQRLSLQARSLKASNRQLSEGMSKIYALAKAGGVAIPQEIAELVEGRLIA